MVKVSVNRYVQHRIEKTRKEVNTTIQKLREKTLRNLTEIYEASSKVTGGEIKHQRINGNMVRVTLRQRRRWLLAAEQTTRTIKNIADNVDEQQINLQLDELEKLVEEAAKP